MARAVTEVTIALQLPDNPVSALLAAHPHARLVFAPLAINGTGMPKRFLVSVHALDADHAELHDALAWLFDDIQQTKTHETGVHTLSAALNETSSARLHAHLGPILEAAQSDILHRPSLLIGRQFYASIVTVHDGPLEEKVRRLVETLNEKGLEARLMHLRPHRPTPSPGSYEEALTDKQSEFLRMALALGLYDTPRRITLEAVASIFGISKAAAHNRMRHAERKVLQEYFEC